MSDFLTDVATASESYELREANRRLQQQLIKAKAKTEELIAAVYQAARDALVVEGFTVTPAPPIDHRRKRPEVALWHLTDWQGAKLTTTYNSAVMRQRVLRFVDTAESITRIQRADHPVHDCAILLGGDMVEGLFQFPTQPFEVDATIFDQWQNVSRLLVEVVRRALGIYDRVNVYGEWGNHGRIGSKRDVVPRSDNLDRMCYATARLALSAEKRLTWSDSAEDIQKVAIGEYRAILMHGDEFGRNGYVAGKTFLEYVNRLKAGAFGWDFQDAYSGHLHTHDERALSDGTGAWYQTGSTESSNRYAGVQLASTARPSQRLHFIDPEKARVTAQYKVWLDDAAV